MLPCTEVEGKKGEQQIPHSVRDDTLAEGAQTAGEILGLVG